MDELVELIYQPFEHWSDHAREVFANAVASRYKRVKAEPLLTDHGAGEKRFQLRTNVAKQDPSKAAFVSLIGPDQDSSGPFGGMSFTVFPSRQSGAPALITMVVGTNGLPPDELVLGRPGHRRKVGAICKWLRSQGVELAWAKHDPVRIDKPLPRTLLRKLGDWRPACRRYGSVIYGVFAPPPDRSPEHDAVVKDGLSAFLDLFFEERQIDVLADHRQDAERIQRSWLAQLLPTANDDDVATLLEHRKYVVLEGPPGTGKTELATRLLESHYGGRGRVIQFHPGTTYESFIGGLAPQEGGAMGFRFAPAAGHLLEAARAASEVDEPWLLVIDEVNRADLAKVLGEAIYLFEPGRHERKVSLAHAFEGVGDVLRLPANLHVLGTMNSADRSIGMIDLAIRRRFAFLSMWPQLRVVEQHGGKMMREAFHALMLIFLEHASDDALALMPGHAYFLAKDAEAQRHLATELVPLLDEYLRQGFVASFADELRAWLDTLSES